MTGKPSRVLALDVGRARIGVAISDVNTGFAEPHCVLNRRDKARDLGAIQNICKDLEVNTVVVGVPLAADGSMTEMGRETERFANRLRAHLGKEVRVVTWDEAMTTVEAEEILGARGVRGKKRRGVVDQVAAAVLLESFLNAKNEPGQ